MLRTYEVNMFIFIFVAVVHSRRSSPSHGSHIYISFFVFQITDLLVNITKHVLKPKHQVLTEQAKQKLLKKFNIEEKQVSLPTQVQKNQSRICFLWCSFISWEWIIHFLYDNISFILSIILVLIISMYSCNFNCFIQFVRSWKCFNIVPALDTINKTRQKLCMLWYHWHGYLFLVMAVIFILPSELHSSYILASNKKTLTFTTPLWVHYDWSCNWQSLPRKERGENGMDNMISDLSP